MRQVSPDRHQATVRNRHQLKIRKWNVQTLMQKGKLENVREEMKRIKISILGLSETRWKGAGCIKSDSYNILFSGDYIKTEGLVKYSILKHLKPSGDFGQSVKGPSL